MCALICAPVITCTAKTDKTSRPQRSELRAYKRAHYAAVPQERGQARDWAYVEARAARQGLVLVGDLHDDAELHGRILELVERCQRAATLAGKEMRLWVEFLGKEDEGLAREYVAGRSSLSELRARLRDRMQPSWLEARELDARFYRRLLERARALSIDVRALEAIPRPPLAWRDAAMAARLDAARERSSFDFVLVGHAHLLGRGHLADALTARGQSAMIVLPNVSVRSAARTPFVELGADVLAWSERY